jgi:hypothetical protein
LSFCCAPSTCTKLPVSREISSVAAAVYFGVTSSVASRPMATAPTTVPMTTHLRRLSAEKICVKSEMRVSPSPARAPGSGSAARSTAGACRRTVMTFISAATIAARSRA